MPVNADEMKRLCSEFDHDFGGVANQVFGAIKKVPAGPALKAIIERGQAKVAKYEDVLSQLSAVHATNFRKDYDERVERLRNNLVKLNEKQKAG